MTFRPLPVFHVPDEANIVGQELFHVNVLKGVLFCTSLGGAGVKDDASRKGLCWVAVARVMGIRAGDSEAKVEDRIESWVGCRRWQRWGLLLGLLDWVDGEENESSGKEAFGDSVAIWNHLLAHNAWPE